jgi:hypothetical protein
MIPARLLFLAALAPALLAIGCGSGSMPGPAVCHKPAPPATVRANSDLPPSFTRDQPYLSTVSSNVARLQQLRQRHLSQYPTRTFSRAPEFRTDFAEYADDSICTAKNLRDLEPSPTSSRIAAYDNTLDAKLDAFVTHMQFGREAVRKRNVSEYREWFDAMDAKLNDVVMAAATRGR